MPEEKVLLAELLAILSKHNTTVVWGLRRLTRGKKTVPEITADTAEEIVELFREHESRKVIIDGVN